MFSNPGPAATVRIPLDPADNCCIWLRSCCKPANIYIILLLFDIMSLLSPELAVHYTSWSLC